MIQHILICTSFIGMLLAYTEIIQKKGQEHETQQEI